MVGGGWFMVRICKIDGCDYPGTTRGWCKSHYSRYWESEAFVLQDRSQPMRVPLSWVDSEKRAMAWAAQQRFDAALQALHDKHRDPDSLKGYGLPLKEGRSLSTLSEEAIR